MFATASSASAPWISETARCGGFAPVSTSARAGAVGEGGLRRVTLALDREPRGREVRAGLVRGRAEDCAHSRFDFHLLVQGLTRSAYRRIKCVSQRFARGAWREALRTFAPGFNREEPWAPRRGTGATISIESEGCTFSGPERVNVASASVAVAKGRGRQRTRGMTHGEAPHVAACDRPCSGGEGLRPFRGRCRREGHHRGNGRRRPPHPHRRIRGVPVNEWRGTPPLRAPRGRWQRGRSLVPALVRVRILPPRRRVGSVPFAPASVGHCSGPCSTFF